LFANLNLRKNSRTNREFALHDYHNVFREVREVLEQYVPKEIEEVRMLEIGCGRRFGITLLFHSLGAEATGIDIDFVDPSFSLSGFLSLWKKSGFVRSAKLLFRRFLFDRTYYQTIERELEKEFGCRLRKDNIDVRRMSACSLELPGNHFDYVFSNAVFEHIRDIDKASREVSRVLIPGGIAFISIHLFPSLSGAHNMEWRRPDEKPSTSVPPWDHLRQNLFPTDIFLNRLREKDYLPVFQSRFSIIDLQSRYEGERFLTDEIRRELPDFSEEELLKRSIKVVMKKR